MKLLKWLLLVPLLAVFFFAGFYLGRGDGYWDRYEGELFVTQLIAARSDALTPEGKAYFNKLIDMNLHSYLMSDDQALQGEAKLAIEMTLVRLLRWKVENGFEPWMPKPEASEEFKFGGPAGAGAAHGYDMEKEYDRYRKRLDVFLDAKFPQVKPQPDVI